MKVWSRQEISRTSFATAANAECAATARDAAQGADVVITATSAKDPVIESDATSTLVVAMGSNHPNRRELPEDLVRQSRVIVDDLEQCRSEAGDLLLALDDDACSN